MWSLYLCLVPAVDVPLRRRAVVRGRQGGVGGPAVEVALVANWSTAALCQVVVVTSVVHSVEHFRVPILSQASYFRLEG